MDRIKGIIDMDGFKIQKKFFCKWSELEERDKRHCVFLKKALHKLPLGVAPGVKAFPIKKLQDIVVDFYNHVKVENGSTLAYKGGTYERDLLAGLQIPSVNLEDFGCPKAEKLFDAMVWLETCGNHTVPNAYHHCAKVEVEAFGQWLRSRYV